MLKNIVFHKDIERDIKGDTSGHFRRLLISLLCASRDESERVDEAYAKECAEKLYSKGEKKWGTDESYFNSVIAAQSYPQLRAVFNAYEKIAKHDIERAIKKEMSGDLERGMLSISKYP